MHGVNAETSACPVCAAPALHALPTVGPGALACDACAGFWLDAGARAWLTPLGTPPSETNRGNCPICAVPLRWFAYRGPTVYSLGVCAEHGSWFDRTGVAAISDSGARVRIVRALIEQNRRLPPDEAQNLIRAVDVVAARAAASIAMGSIVRPLGNPALVTIGVGAVAIDGVQAIAPDGQVRVLVKPMSRWTMSLIVAGVLGVTLSVVMGYIAIKEDFVTALIVAVALVFTFCFGTGMFVVMAIVTPRSRIVLDSRNGNLDVLQNGRAEVRVPYPLISNTRVQLYSDPGYADRYDVLVNLGFAELWILQTSDPKHAREMAADIARTVGVSVDPVEERKA
jgi:hypothetical protein